MLSTPPTTLLTVPLTASVAPPVLPPPGSWTFGTFGVRIVGTEGLLVDPPPEPPEPPLVPPPVPVAGSTAGSRRTADVAAVARAASTAVGAAATAST